MAKNQSGQGLIEYLIITALMAVACIGVIRLLNHTVTAQFANVTNALQGKAKTKVRMEAVEDRHYKKKDLSNFLNGATNKREQDDEE